MSNIGQAFSSGGGITDQTLADASFGDVMQGGTGDFGTGAGANAFTDAGNNFPSFNAIANAFSGGTGGNPPIVNASAFTAPAAAGGGGDPVAAQGGTQSGTSSGGRQGPEQNQQQQQSAPGQPPQQQPLPPQIQELRDALRKLLGPPPGPTGLTPPRTPTVPGALNALFGNQQANARTPPPDQVGRSITVQPKAAPVPPYEPSDTGPPAPPQTTQLGPEAPAPAPAPAPLPGPGGAVMPQPATPQQAQPQQMSRIMQDLAGLSTGNPAALADLAHLLYGVGAPLAALGAARRPHGGFGPVGQSPFGGFRSPWGALPPETSPDEWQKEQDARDRAQAENDVLGRTDKNGNPNPNGPFDKNGAYVASPDKTPVSNEIPGVTPKMVDAFVRQEAPKYGIDPDTASKFIGAESGYGQNNLGDKDANGNPTSFGPLQLHMAPGAMGDQFLRDTGQRPQDFAKNWQQQIDYALGKAAKEGWTPGWTTSMKKLGLGQWSGIRRPAPAVSSLTGTDARASFLVS